jgi:hypothetical protein
MRLVLDANEYIYALGEVQKPSCEQLILSSAILRSHDVRIVRTVVEEVLRNIPEAIHADFYGIIDEYLEEDFGIDEQFVIPYPLGLHYRDLGFKEADALIAAYADVVGADLLISEICLSIYHR